MQTLAELIAQRETLDKQIKEAKKLEHAEVIAGIHKLITQYEFTALDLFPKKKGRPKSSGKIAPKFKNPDTGDTWTGRGKPPKWIQGQDKNKFLIAWI